MVVWLAVGKCGPPQATRQSWGLEVCRRRSSRGQLVRMGDRCRCDSPDRL